MLALLLFAQAALLEPSPQKPALLGSRKAVEDVAPSGAIAPVNLAEGGAFEANAPAADFGAALSLEHRSGGHSGLQTPDLPIKVHLSEARPADVGAVMRPAETEGRDTVVTIHQLPLEMPAPPKKEKKTLFGLETLHALFSPLNIPVVIRPQGPGLFGDGQPREGRPEEPTLAGMYATGDQKLHGKNAELQRRRWLMSGVAQYLNLPKAVAERLTVQDVAVLISVMAFYIATLGIALSLVFHTSVVRSGVKWFSEPEMLTCTGTTYSAFCSVFNRAPSTHVRIKSTKNGLPQMDVALDVTNFIEPDEDLFYAGKRCELGGGSMTAEDVRSVEQFVSTPAKLATLVMSQSVAWDDFERLQPMVEERLRSLGCDEEVKITFERARDPVIRRNTQLYHFMNNNITLILALMSIVGPLVFWPVAWWQRKTWYCTTKFRIPITAEEYLPLVVDALPLAIEATRSRQEVQEQEAATARENARMIQEAMAAGE